MPGTKLPAIAAWPKAATSDPVVVAGWWEWRPAANIGLVCGETFDVLDIEAKAIATLDRWMAARAHMLPEGPLVATGGGGLHLYVLPSGLRTAELRLDGVHVGEHRGRGGHAVLAPPSRTSGRYTWLIGPDVPLPSVPQWVLGLRHRQVDGRARRVSDSRRLTGVRGLDALAWAVASATEGTRNATLFWAACRAAEESHPGALSDRVLLRAALSAGLRADEATATIASARRRARL